MANRLILEVGQGQVEIAIKGTAAQIRGAVRRYAETVGIDITDKTDVQIGEAVLRYVLRSVKESSMAKQRTEKFAELAAGIEAEILAANDIYDEPT